MAGVKNARQITLGKLSPAKLGIRAIDSHILEIRLDEPVHYFLNMLANPLLFPVPQKVVEQWGDRWTRPEYMVSNGAFSLAQWVVNEKIVLKRNPHYWDNQNTRLDEVTFLPLGSDEAALSRYRAGQLDISNIPHQGENYQTLLRRYPGQVFRAPLLAEEYLAFNLARKPFDDKRVRLALAYAIDRQTLTHKVLGMGERPVYTLTPPTTHQFHPPARDGDTGHRLSGRARPGLCSRLPGLAHSSHSG